MKETVKEGHSKHLARKKGVQASKEKATRLNWPTAKASGTVYLKKELQKKDNIRQFPEKEQQP